MRNIKTLLKLLGAVSLSTVAVSSVVACYGGDNDTTNFFSDAVSQNLKLTDANGKGLILPIINVDNTDNSKITWKIDVSNIKVTELVDSNKKAKDKDSFNFLKNNLKIKIENGSTFEDAVFNETELNSTTIEVSDINVDLKPTKTKKDFYIANGSYNIMFTNGTTKTDKYKIVTKLSTENDTSKLIGEIIKFTLGNASFNSDFQSKFKVGQSVSNFQIGADLASKLVPATNSAKKILGIEKLIKITAKILVVKNDKTTGNFVLGDKIKIQDTFGEVKFLTEDLTVNP